MTAETEGLPSGPRTIGIDVDLAVDLAWLLKHPDELAVRGPEGEDIRAMYASLVRYINTSGKWHVVLNEEIDDGQ